MEDNKQTNTPQGGEGRTHNREGEHGVNDYKPVHQSSDISDVDQQEGAMQNGETGGNFNNDAATSGSGRSEQGGS